MAFRSICLIAGVSLAGTLRLAPRAPAARAVRVGHCRRAAVFAAAADDDDVPVGGLINPSDKDMLSARIASIQQNGLASPAQKLFELATEQPPQQLLRDFFRSASPMVGDAMKEAVTSLLGQLPPLEFDAQMTTTADKLAALLLQLQMTGYMLRNAEYVVALRRVLELKSRSIEEYRAAFERVDLDQSGYIELDEVEQLLKNVYGDGEEVPPFEVASFLTLFDADGDGRISWAEFAEALGAVGDAAGAESAAPRLDLTGEDDEGEGAAPTPTLSGEVTVTMDDGTEMTMDASAYMEQLKAEASTLRAELKEQLDGERIKEQALANSLTAYVSSLPEGQLKLLTSGISDDVLAAMKQLVEFILRAPGQKNGSIGKEQPVTIEGEKLNTLCLYQLVLGYKLREAEATGEAQKAIGM